MEDLDITLAEKAQEGLETMHLCTQAMQKADSDEKRMMLLAHTMHLLAHTRHIISEALTDDELQMIKNDMGDEWDMWKNANTPEGAVTLLKCYDTQ